MHEGKLPEIWKIACITPIYKGKGSKHDVANFRPISLTSVICKIMESIIKDRIMQHCTDNNLISSTHSACSQSGENSTFCNVFYSSDLGMTMTLTFKVKVMRPHRDLSNKKDH